MSTKQVRTARKTYWCPDTSYAHDRRINPGDKYVRITVFPHDDVFVGPKPRQYVLCLECGTDLVFATELGGSEHRF